MSFKTASAILRGTWLIDPSWATQHMPLVLRMVKGEPVEFGIASDKDPANTAAVALSHKAGVVYSVNYYTNLDKLPSGSIALVDIVGPVMKYGDYCAWGSVDHAATINRLANAGNVSGIILNVDSPGGEASGTGMLAEVIKAAATRKPIIGLVDDAIAASAAMWIISACMEIYTTQKTDMLGSVGAYTTIVDWYSYFESEGLKVRDIFAPQSTEKCEEYTEALNGNDEPMKANLKVLVDEFLTAVQTNRGSRLTGDEWKKGKMFFTKDAIRIGLIDGRKTIDQVIKRMDQLVSTKNTQNNNHIMAFEKTLTAAKSESFPVVAAGETTEGGFLIQEEQLNNIEASITESETVLATANSNLETANASLAAAQEEVTTANAAVEAANANVTSLTDQLNTANARITELEAMGGKSVTTEKEADKFEGNKKTAMDFGFQKELLAQV